MTEDKSYDIDAIIDDHFQRKINKTYEIKHKQRQEARNAWIFSRTETHALNTHLSFSFPTNGSASEDDVQQVRAVAHKLRVWLRSQKPSIPSHLIWSRNVPGGNDREFVDILVHVPEKDAKGFKSVVEGWDYGIKVEPITYEADRFYAGKPCTIFEEMFRASSAETRIKNPDAPHQTSAPMKGNRFFFSRKLKLYERIEHRKQNSPKVIEGTAIIVG